MHKVASSALKSLKSCRTIIKCNNTTRSYYTDSLRSVKDTYYMYLFPGISFCTYAAYKATVKCEGDVKDEWFMEHTNETKPEKWTIYQYATCPFCCKVRAFLDYYGIEYEKVEVNPVSRKEIKFSDYRKVPIVKSDNHQINDSSLIISVLKSYIIGKGSIDVLLTYYPFLEDDDKKGKGHYQNVYNIMYQQGFSREQNLAIREESKWRRWVDEIFVHTLSPNIYRTMNESLKAMEYITEVGNFSDWEKKVIYYSGAVAMYLIGKRLKMRHHLRNDVRESLYEEARRWTHNVGSKRPFMGGTQPNLADLNMYGVISAIEGLDAFDDLMKNTKIGPWYKRMKTQVDSHQGRKDNDWITTIKPES